ncbi:uncharacterized protein LOC116004598 [Ipomoea triloba]|uniref:uncharacterized protein LOC116004598 n=1 Tax=Ipomoea triloba TaxID=35885 RepID=UPI00125CFD08|nr:uncharacterized protein LOC116004598 [Ipomoea triloba]
MDTPPLSSGPISSAAAAVAAAGQQQPQIPPPPPTHVNYADSIDSSPRSRNTDWDEPPPYAAAAAPGGGKLRLMCSYGGHIVPRPHDKSLCYVGGDTRIIVTDRHSSLSDLSLRLSKTLLNGRSFSLKYQLPNEDLDSLISVTTDEDLENMIDEYDRINSNSNGTKTSRLRLFLFPSKSDTMSSIGSLLESSTKSEDWFLNALNGATSTSTKVLSESSSVNCLLGLDDDIGNGNSTGKDAEPLPDGSVNIKNGGVNHAKVNAQDVHSVPDSPMLAMTSSFDSTSSSPPLGNLPPIRVRVEDNHRVGIEEHFSQMTIGAGAGAKVEQKQEEGGFAALTSPPAPPVAVGGEYPSRVYSDDERSEHGVPVGYSKPPLQQQPSQQPPQMQPKPPTPTDLPSPGSVSSEGSASNPLSRPKQYIYQDPMMQIQPGVRVSANPVDPMISDPNSRAQVQPQVQDSGYVLPGHFDHHPQLHQHQHPQYVQAGQFVHHIPAGAMPISSYYPVYPSQQQHHHPQHPALEHQFPVYFVQQPTPTQTYNLPVQQTSEPSPTASTRPQTPPATTVVPPTSDYNTPRNVPASKPEMNAGSYRTAVAPQLVQVAPGQHLPQYAGFTQIHHPSQSTVPTSAATGNYAYAFTDPTHAQIYYTQPFAPQMSAQYQTMKSVHGIPEASSQLPTENLNQHA